MAKNINLKNVTVDENGFPQVEIYVEGSEKSYWLSPFRGCCFQVSETASSGDCDCGSTQVIGMSPILNVGGNSRGCESNLKHDNRIGYILAQLAMSAVLDFSDRYEKDTHVSAKIFSYGCRFGKQEESADVLDQFIDAVYNWLVNI